MSTHATERIQVVQLIKWVILWLAKIEPNKNIGI